MATLRNKILILFFLLYTGAGKAESLAGQKVSDNTDISKVLLQMGMENVHVADQEYVIIIAYDDNIYRGTFRGLYEVIRELLDEPGINKAIHLVVQDNRIPQIAVHIPKEWQDGYRNGLCTLPEVMRNLDISYNTSQDMRPLKGVKRENSSEGKIDLVLYPQVILRNSWLEKLYGTVLNIAPAIEVGLWRGASFTGQVIFPVWNNLNGEVDYIRAGMLVVRQQIRFPGNLFATISAGNFNNDRMGLDAALMYHSPTDRWAFGLEAGLTGSSTFYEGRWELSQWRRINGSILIRYNEPVYHLEMDVRVLRYVYGDYGARVDCSRHFGEVTVGVFAMCSGGEVNGGFHLAFPFPMKKRNRNRAVRIRLPEYFDWEYEAQSGPEYTRRKLGRYYETRPDENRSRDYYNPAFIKDNLVKLSLSDDRGVNPFSLKIVTN